MSSPNPNPGADNGPSMINEAAQLRQFAGTPEEFWPAFLKLACGVAGAVRAVLIRRDTTDGKWKQLGEWAPADAPTTGVAQFRGNLISLAEECATNGSVKRLLAVENRSGTAPIALAAKLTLGTPQELCMVAVFLPEALPAQLDSILLRLQLL